MDAVRRVRSIVNVDLLEAVEGKLIEKLVGDPIFEPTDSRLQTVSSLPEEEPSARDLIVKTFVSVPEVSTDGKIPAASASPSEPVRVPRLPATRIEAVRIAQIVKQAGAPADVLLDLQASEGELLKRDLKQYRILHFATHGLLAGEAAAFLQARGEPGFMAGA